MPVGGGARRVEDDQLDREPDAKTTPMALGDMPSSSRPNRASSVPNTAENIHR